MALRVIAGLLSLAWFCYASSNSSNLIENAQALYKRTDYNGSLRLLISDAAPGPETYELLGKNYFMLGDYRAATQSFEKALSLKPQSSEYELWLGRAYGKRAETAGWFLAAPNASKARQHLEKASLLDAHNAEASNDLFDYYLNAPEFLGGGLEKAEKIARQIAVERPAEHHFELAQIAERRKNYPEAEAHLQKAIELAPGQIGRTLDLARYLARRGRIVE